MKRLYYSIKAMTPLHVGVGTGLGHIDLPIQREVHTKFPMIPGTAVKGALREYKLREFIRGVKDLEAKIRQEIPNSEISNLLIDMMGIDKLDRCLASCGEGGDCPKFDRLKEIKVNNINNIQLKEEIENIEKKLKNLVNRFGCQNQAGNLAFSDLRILLFPVKSLNGIFAYITSPAVLRRLAEDISLLLGSLPELKLDKTEAYTTVGGINKIEGSGSNLIVLEEFTFISKEFSNDFINWIIGAFDKAGIKFNEVANRLVLVHDDAFNDFVQNYTEVQTHVKIDPSTGTVQTGALWTEEYLPAETFMYGIIFEVRNNKSEDTDLTEGLLPDYLHLGGDITTGKGFVRIYEGEKEG